MEKYYRESEKYVISGINPLFHRSIVIGYYSKTPINDEFFNKLVKRELEEWKSTLKHKKES